MVLFGRKNVKVIVAASTLLGACLSVVLCHFGLRHYAKIVEIREQQWKDGWKAMRHVPKNKRWGPPHTEALRSIALPRWSDAPDDASEDDRLGDAWLPPRLPIADELRTLDHGILFCATGGITFAEKQVVPIIRHLIENLGIRPDAKERAALRRRGERSGGSQQGFALVTARKFVDGPLKDWVAFFDAVYLVEDLPAYPFDWQESIRSSAIVKATKVHVMASAPFDTTIMLDLDSFPCRSDFARPLLEAFGSADIGFTNIVDEMADVRDDRHFLGEHNSALVVLNMKSARTRVLMALYIQAYHHASETKKFRKSGKQRDQPCLLIAMQAMAKEFQPHDGQRPEVPNASVRQLLDRHKLGFVRHVDFDSSLVCRRMSKGVESVVCSPDSSCVIAHKDKELYKSKTLRNAEEGDDEEGDDKEGNDEEGDDEEGDDEEGDDKEGDNKRRRQRRRRRRRRTVDEEADNNGEEGDGEEGDGEEGDGEEGDSEEGDNKEGELTKFFGVGFKKTGTSSLDKMFSHLIDTWGGSRPWGRVRAVNELIKGVSDAKSMAQARDHQYFQDAPWCQEPQRLYRKLAHIYPTAKFILTVRDPDQWYNSVSNWVRCRPEEGGLCGDEKMERYRAIFGANSTSQEDFISAFVSHNNAVRQFFFEELKQPHRLFEIDLTDEKHNGGAGWALFCDFVGLSEEQCPRGDIPHKNKTPASPALGEEEE